MLTKNQSKRILSLRQKKQRLKQGLFIVEGPKVVQEFIDSNYELVEIFSTSNNHAHFEEKFTIIDDKVLKKISSLVTPNTVFNVNPHWSFSLREKRQWGAFLGSISKTN